MALSDLFEKIGRTLFEAPFGAIDGAGAPELAEIRIAVLEAVKAHARRVAGRDVFPHNQVRIRLWGVTAGTDPAFLEQFFEQELRAALARSGARYPQDIRIELETSPELADPWLAIEVGSAPVEHVSVDADARVTVVKGTANVATLALEKARTNIGRTVDVYRSGGPSRRNDVAFSDESVSREHAHITFDRRTGEYRLFNDRWYQAGAACGLWILRDGLSREVHRDARGVRLEPGDEIQLGRAVLRFER